MTEKCEFYKDCEDAHRDNQNCGKGGASCDRRARIKQMADNPKPKQPKQSHKSETGYYYGEPGSYGKNP